LDRPSYSPVVPLTDGKIGAEIIESCRSGDRNAFRVLYEIYKDRVYSMALYFFHGDPAAAADTTQQVFLKLLTGIGQFRRDSEFSTWLYRLVVNVCIDTARQRKSQAIDTALPRLGDLTTPGSQEIDFARAERARSVRQAISALPPKFRMAILLRYFDDLSYEEMAKALRCSMGTVASRLSRGHKMLADRLQSIKDQRC
jgi:RNA polymerase sigma-70 factor, ECF subfamily